jgi:long-chain fatty acid transport protein
MKRASPSPPRAGLAIALAGLSLLALPSPADAAGLYVTERGVRPLGRGGAFVAGADDLGSVAYNPAGLYDAGMSVLLDASYVHFSSEYTRRAIVRQTDPNTGETVGESTQTFASVQGSTPFLPIPTLGLSFVLNEKWVVGVGLWAPYAAIATYPDTLNGRPAPQRYSLLSLEGSALTVAGAYAAYAITPALRVGAGIEVLTGAFESTVMFSGCVPDRFFCAPEQPAWDVLAELAVVPIVAPSGNLGVVWIPAPKFRVGLSGHLPFWIRAPATVRTRLPAAAPFAGARQEGENASVAFELPWNVKAGVEARPLDALRVELALGYEGWGVHDAIRVDPDRIALKDVAGFPETYYIPPVDLARGFRGAFSARLGGEYAIPIGKQELDVRAGAMFETSAVPREYLSVLTVDTNKVTTSLGASFHAGPIRLDIVYAHSFMFDEDVDPREGKITQVSPVQANPPANPNIINGGTYVASADIIGLGAVYTFGKTATAKTAEKAPEEKQGEDAR